MNKTPLFSILIANYNNSHFLEECVESVKSQSYSNWEIIIVDDCSTDKPGEIYSQLKTDSRIRIAYNESNRKTAYTFKRALDLSQGEICGFLGPDDTLHPKAIEETLAKHLERPDCSIVYTLNYLCDEFLNIIELFKWGGALPDGESQLTVPPGKKITSFASFKKSYYEKTEGIDIKFTRGYDQDFYYKMEEAGKVYCIEKPLYYYRKHAENISLNENNIKARYWLYVANKDAYHRRKRNSLPIKNITFGELQRSYLQVCLLKIDQKLRTKNYRHICFYYWQLCKLFLWDNEFLIVKKHVFFIKRFLSKT